MDPIESLADRLDSLHGRMDKFYEWAAILQKEFRDIKQRQAFTESIIIKDAFQISSPPPNI